MSDDALTAAYEQLRDLNGRVDPWYMTAVESLLAERDRLLAIEEAAKEVVEAELWKGGVLMGRLAEALES